jgi:hypothetical protein
MSLYWEERIFRSFRLGRAFVFNFCAFAGLFAPVSSILHLRTVAAGLPFLAGAMVRMFQKTSWRPVWYFAPVLPTIATALNGGRLLGTGGESPLWFAVLLRCIGQAIACYFLTLLADGHQRRRSTL